MERAAYAIVANGVAGDASGGGRSKSVSLLRRGSRERPEAHALEMPLAGERIAARKEASTWLTQFESGNRDQGMTSGRAGPEVGTQDSLASRIARP